MFGKVLSFNFTECGPKELFLEAGAYELEVWGASGGTRGVSNALGGAGGYSKGFLTLREKTRVFVHVGSQGSDDTYGMNTAGCNGGGYTSSACHARSGGGATDIRLKTDSLFSRVIVAGGGGGTGDGSGEYGGSGGGENGGDGGPTSYLSIAGKGANQTSPTVFCADGTNSCPSGTFGYGGNTSNGCAGGGGGGWFGGSASRSEVGGGGGSGYAFTKSSFKPEGFLLSKDFYLENAVISSGINRGNGYAKITFLNFFIGRRTCYCRRRTISNFFIFLMESFIPK